MINKIVFDVTGTDVTLVCKYLDDHGFKGCKVMIDDTHLRIYYNRDEEEKVRQIANELWSECGIEYLVYERA